MPKLLAFLPCDRAIVSQDDQNVSLITVIHGVDATVPEEIVGKNVQLPHQWAVVTIWSREPADEGVALEQRLEYLSPSGKPLFAQDTQFVFQRVSHTNVGRIGTLPVERLTAGTHTFTLRLSIRRVGEDQFKVVSEFPFRLALTVASAPVSS